MADKRRKCKECPLYIEREVPYDATMTAQIAWIGESPGREELAAGRCYVGATGQLLKGEIKELKIPTELCGFFNSARCMINKKELSTKEIKQVLGECRTHLEAVLQKLKPKLIVIMGAIALEQVLKMKGIERVAGEFLYSEEFQCDCFVLNHPAATLHDPTKLPRWKKHMAMVASYVNNDFTIPEVVQEFDYKAVSTIRPILNKTKITVAIDTETQGKDHYDPNSIVLCYSISAEKEKGKVIWLHAEVPVDKADFTIQWPRKKVEGKKTIKEIVEVGIKRLPKYEQKLDELRELLAREDIKKVMQNGTYDMLRFEQLLGEFELNSYTMDIQAAAHVIDENTYQQSDLEHLMADFSDMPFHQKKVSQEGIIKEDMLAANPQKVTRYAGSDSDGTRRVSQTLRTRLLQEPNTARYFVKMVMPVLQYAIFPIARNGIYLDRARIPAEKKAIDDEIEKYSSACLEAIEEQKPGVIEAYRDTGKGLTLTRKNIMRDFLFDSEIGHGLNAMRHTATGQPGVGKDDLTILRDMPDVSEEIVVAINNYLKFSEYHTLRTRYINGFEEAMQSDSRIYPSYSLTKTVTGRLAGSDPNPLNFPKRQDSAVHIRRLIAAPPGWNLLALDYSQSELRWIAHVAQDKRMLQIFRESGDIHVTTAEAVLGKDLSKASKKEAEVARRSAKAINFGLTYGMGAVKFQRECHSKYGLIITLREAEEYKRMFFQDLYQELPAWHEKYKSKARRDKYVVSPYGRRRHLPSIDSPDSNMVALAERMAINFPIQAASSDSGLYSMASVEKKGKLDKRKAIPLIFIHDELVYCVKDGYEEKAKKAIIEEMENIPFEEFGFKMTVPLKADCKIGPNLAEMIKF